MDLTIGSTTRPYAGLSYEEAFARIGKAGYTDVAIFANQSGDERVIPVRSDSTAAEIAAVKAAAASAGVAPSMVLGRAQLDQGLDGAVTDYKKLLDNAAALGVRWILELGTSKEAFYEIYPQVMRQAAAHAHSLGLGISLKPHGGISLTARELIDLCEKVNHAAFSVSYDPGNIIYYTKGEVRPESEVGEIAAITSTAIIKDCVIRDDGKPDVNVTAGDGLVEFYTVLSGLVGGGFSGPLYVECVGSSLPDDVDRDLAFTRGYVKGVLTSL
ncbi:MAG: TIM barrel protein [bacterium]|jgi:sugar phosphate isomerase/epimerase|nr:TIM barrel protein [bacterium]